MKTVYAPYIRYDGTSGHYCLNNNSIAYGNETFLYFRNNLKIMGMDKLLQKEKYK